MFIRAPKQADHNALNETVCVNRRSHSSLRYTNIDLQKLLSFGDASERTQQALIFATVYNSLPWGHRLLSRCSEHVLLSSQSLGDLFDCIPCISNELPEESIQDGTTSWKEPTVRESTGAVICIEDIAYGDGQSEHDYSE